MVKMAVEKLQINPDTSICKSVRLFFVILFSAIFRLNCDLPVVSVVGNWSTQQKPLPNPKSKATLTHASTGIRKRSMWMFCFSFM